MAISNILETGRQGLETSRQALQLAAQNIANTNTPGYSRQKAVIESVEQEVTRGAVRGGGVRFREPLRVHDEFLEKQLIEEARGYGGAMARAGNIRRVQDIVGNEAFRVGDIVNNFFNSVRDLSANPEEPTLRVNLINAAKQASTNFQEIHRQLDGIRKDLDFQLETQVGRVNELTTELADLNANISRATALRAAPNELLDKRDAVVRELAQKLNVQVLTDQFNQKNLILEGVGVLVAGSEHNDLTVMRTPAEGEKVAGSADVFLKTPQALSKATHRLTDGELAGLVQVRDQVLNPAINGLDTVAFELTRTVNEVHRQGTGADGLSGRNLFREPNGVQDAAYFMEIEEGLESNPSMVATGFQADSPSDNRICLDIADLQNAKLLPHNLRDLKAPEPPVSGEYSDDTPAEENELGWGGASTTPSLEGQQTLNEALTNMIGEVGSRAHFEDEELRHQESIMQQLTNYRESVSGVSLEEEALNIMQFQTTFNASARAMKMGSELFQTILDIAD